MNQIFSSQEILFNDPVLDTVDSKLSSLEDLKPYIGKVVKYTNDWGKTWQFFLLDQCVYFESAGQNQEIAGVKCFSEKRLWNRRLVGASALFTKESFVKGRFSEPQSYFETASYSEFSNLAFQGVQGSGKLPEDAASKPCTRIPRFTDFPPMIDKAPLTIVRSEKPSQLAISILFDSKYDPRDPIIPSPTLIEPESRTYTWKIQTNEDATLSVEKENKTQERVKMVWWEATRKTAPIPFDPISNGVTVARADLRNVLHNILEKKGVKESEARSFAEFWEQTFQADFDEVDAPYVAVELIEKEALDQFLPQMKVESADAEFKLHRFYFRFQPAEKREGIEKSAYLDAIKPSECGPNAVIDLGGEIVPSKYKSTDKSDSKEFIDDFIRNHIIA